MLGLGTLALGIRNELTKDVRDEENLVSSLSAGQDLSRFSAALGPPDTKRPAGRYLIYQFQRRRETLQAVVNRVGAVVSYGVYAKTRDFHPSFEHGAAVTLNSTAVDGGTTSAGLAAMGYCAAHKAGYFEASGGGNAAGARYFVLGVSDANTTAISTAAICRAGRAPWRRASRTSGTARAPRPRLHEHQTLLVDDCARPSAAERVHRDRSGTQPSPGDALSAR